MRLTIFYLKLIIPIAVVCLTFMLITRAIGTTQPPNPALRGFIEGCEDKPQPCWYGIVPGVTTAEAAQQLLQTHGISGIVEDGLWNGRQTRILRISDGVSLNCNKISYVDSDKPDEDLIQFFQCSSLDFGQLSSLIKYPGTATSFGCYEDDAGVSLGYLNSTITLKNLPILHQTALVTSFTLYPDSKWYSVENINNLVAILDDTMKIAFPPKKNLHYLKLILIEDGGCG